MPLDKREYYETYEGQRVLRKKKPGKIKVRQPDSLRNKVHCALGRSKASFASQKLSESAGYICQTLKKIVLESRDNVPNIHLYG